MHRTQLGIPPVQRVVTVALPIREQIRHLDLRADVGLVQGQHLFWRLLAKKLEIIVGLAGKMDRDDLPVLPVDEPL